MLKFALLVIALAAAAEAQNVATYGQALKVSLLFYEAQRSGPLPGNNRVKWRKSSALKDGQDKGVNLVGGYYDAGDHVKFNFPLAFTMTVLAWGGIDNEAGYKRAGQYNYLLQAIKWGTDYLIKCHTKKDEYYFQVGDGVLDHAFWGRAEKMRMARPSFKVDKQKRGSDVAGEAAAALASASILFKKTNRNYSNLLLRHARELFDLAYNYQGTYTQDSNGFDWERVRKYYYSNSYHDELAWSGAWLYRATGQASYRQKAESSYSKESFNQYWPFGWENKMGGAAALLAKLPGTQKGKYINNLRAFCNDFRGGTKSPRGQRWYSEWGSLRVSCNAALICAKAASLNIDANANRNMARQQLNYVLGSSGRSYVVGFGKNPPQQPHHRDSSCPLNGGWCTDKQNARNPNVLTGAVVGGPLGSNDGASYNDYRGDYKSNEVAMDYNAAFQSLAAYFA